MSNREMLLISVDTLNATVKQVGKDINKSVLNLLRDQSTPQVKKKKARELNGQPITIRLKQTLL